MNIINLILTESKTYSATSSLIPKQMNPMDWLFLFLFFKKLDFPLVHNPNNVFDFQIKCKTPDYK